MAAVNQPLAVFEDDSGKKIKVYNPIDVKEWEAAGYKRSGAKKQRVSKPKAEQKVIPEQPKTEQHKKTIAQTLKSIVTLDDDEL